LRSLPSWEQRASPSVWLTIGSAAQAFSRGALFLAAIVATHALALRLYRRQPIAWSPAYWPAIKFSAVAQALMLLFASILLIAPDPAPFVTLGFVGFWAGIAIVVLPQARSADEVGNLAFIRGGSMLVFVIAIVFGLLLPRIADFSVGSPYSLAPVLRGEGGGEGWNCQRRACAIDNPTPHPNPLP